MKVEFDNHNSEIKIFINSASSLKKHAQDFAGRMQGRILQEESEKAGIQNLKEIQASSYHQEWHR